MSPDGWGAAPEVLHAMRQFGSSRTRERGGDVDLDGPLGRMSAAPATTRRAANLVRQRARRRLVRRVICLTIFLCVLALPTAGHSASGTADEVHYTFTGPTSVAFDWRGSATDIRYGTTTSYGSTATSHTPSPLPFSSGGPF